MKPREYQEAAIQSIFDYFQTGGPNKTAGGNPLVAMPTGTGKSIVICEFIKRAFLQYPHQRFIKLTHVKELIEQNYKTLLRVWPTAPAGIFSAGLGQKQTCFPITFAGIASIVKNPAAFGRVDLVLIDEAHLLSPRQDTMYQKFLGDLRSVNPNLRIVGFTATHYRVGQGLLTDGGGVFSDICFDLTTLESFNWLLEQGYLCPLIPKRTQTELPVEGVRVQGGEYVQKDLQESVDKSEITYATLKETIDLGADRKHWLVFASGVNHACHVRDTLDALGVDATVVHSRMADKERDQNIRDFKAGKYRAMVNNGILTTGFDYPEIDLICMLRPTKSPGLWVQMLGRGTRPVYTPGFDLDTLDGRLASIQASSKHNCLVLDFAGNTRRLGPINDPIIPSPKRGGGGGSAPVKLCEVCGVYNHASVRFCIFCGTEFIRHLNLTPGASTDELIKVTTAQIVPFKVDKITFQEHKKVDRPTSLRVSYYCGIRLFNEWICFEHEGFPRKKAHDWWRNRSKAYAWAVDQLDSGADIKSPEMQSSLSIPKTTVEAMTRINELKSPCEIKVWINKPHPEIMMYNYENV